MKTFFRPRLEKLEDRDLLSGGGSELLSLNVTYGTRTNITLYGTLTDGGDPVPSHTIHLYGHVDTPPLPTSTIPDTTTTTDTNGNFSVNVQANRLGRVDATDQGGGSNVATLVLSVPAPVIQNFAWSLVGTVSHFTGHINSQDGTGLTVSFSGEPVSMQNKTVVTNAVSNFDYAIQLNGLATDNGVVYAVMSDWWGQVSNTVQVTVSQPGT